ncbi:FMN-dependent NADH-azoreductase [Mycoplasmopsis lipofaciens]|uniref:FMN-dependent NADH-azoreductase n=1 Tax=Mycoplasmopsis lipofaciens TaxID=114884 RepID=UPI00047FD34A|nr:FMN-dependent NADH-azoreductase [Mycoplasmopsis lipofaciens]
MKYKPLKVLCLNTSVNQKSLTDYISMELIKKINDKNKNNEITFLDLNNSPFAENQLTSLNRDEFFVNVESDIWIDKLKNIDLLVLNAPMYNFSYSSTLKSFIDSICVANKTFTYKYSGKGQSKGFLENLNVIIIGSQGAPKGWYPFGDHIKLLEGTFNFLGAKNIQSLLIDGTKYESDKFSNFEDVSKKYEIELEKIIELLY